MESESPYVRGRSLLHYTLAMAQKPKLQLLDEINTYIASLPTRNQTAPARGSSPTPAQGIQTAPAQGMPQPRVSNCPSSGKKTAPAQGDSNLSKELEEEDSEVWVAQDERRGFEPVVELLEDKPSRRAKPRTRFPVEVTGLGDDGLRYALSEGLTEAEAHEQFKKFRNHHIGKGSVMADWSAAWRTWIGNAKEFGHVGPKKQQQVRGGKSSIVHDSVWGD